MFFFSEGEVLGRAYISGSTIIFNIEKRTTQHPFTLTGAQLQTLTFARRWHSSFYFMLIFFVFWFFFICSSFNIYPPLTVQNTSSLLINKQLNFISFHYKNSPYASVWVYFNPSHLVLTDLLTGVSSSKWCFGKCCRGNHESGFFINIYSVFSLY